MTMKKLMRCAPLLIIALIVLPGRAPAQFKSELENQPSSAQGLFKPNTSIGSFLGLLDVENFSMHHTFSMNYLSSSGGGLSVASYTNSMFYQIANPLDVRVDLTLMGSPFGSYAGYQQNDYTKFFVSRAQLNYKPWENTSIRLEYNQIPFGSYNYYNRFAPSPFMMGDQ
jgi:hypothetical protein